MSRCRGVEVLRCRDIECKVVRHKGIKASNPIGGRSQKGLAATSARSRRQRKLRNQQKPTPAIQGGK